MSIQRALSAYRKIKNESCIDDASPHRLIQMLMEGFLDKINLAKFYLNEKNIEKKCTSISSAISILDGLQSSLDKKKGGEIAENLFEMYDYMMTRLIEANLKNNVEYLNEVIDLMVTIKTAWDQIGDNNGE